MDNYETILLSFNKNWNNAEKNGFLTALISLSDRTQMSGVRKISLNNLPPDLILEDANSKNKTEQDLNNKVSTYNLHITICVVSLVYILNAYLTPLVFAKKMNKLFLNVSFKR